MQKIKEASRSLTDHILFCLWCDVFLATFVYDTNRWMDAILIFVLTSHLCRGKAAESQILCPILRHLRSDATGCICPDPAVSCEGRDRGDRRGALHLYSAVLYCTLSVLCSAHPSNSNLSSRQLFYFYVSCILFLQNQIYQFYLDFLELSSKIYLFL